MTIPNYERETVEKLVKKARKHIEDVSVSFGKPYKKAYKHGVIKNGDMFSLDEATMIHNVIDMTLTLPDANNWRLKCKYEQGVPHITDMTKPLEIKVAAHGETYNKCDACGHKAWAKSYLIENTETGEELQVGSECMKTFGITKLVWLDKLVHVLYQSLVCGEDDSSDCDFEYDECRWCFKKDPHATRSVEVVDCIKAAKQYYDDNNGAWESGYYDGRYYVPSASKGELHGYIIDKKFSELATDEYVSSLQSYLRDKVFPTATPPDQFDGGFDWEMCEALKNYYISIADCSFAFFAVKKYEQWLAAQKLTKIEKGDYVHVTGIITSHRREEGYYGVYDRFEVKANSGHIVRRNGKIATTKGEDGVERAEFYAMVEYVSQNGSLSIGRATTKPKKGIQYIAI